MFFAVFVNMGVQSLNVKSMAKKKRILPSFSTKSVKNLAMLLTHIGGSGVILSNSGFLPEAFTQKIWGKGYKQDDFLSTGVKLLGWNFLVLFSMLLVSEGEDKACIKITQK